MGKIKYSVLVIVSIFCVMSAYAAEKKYENYIFTEEGIRIPAGMELKKVGDANILIPKGAKIYKTGDLLVVETAGEYAARRFLEMEERVKRIEKGQEIIKEKIEELNKAVYKK